MKRTPLSILVKEYVRPLTQKLMELEHGTYMSRLTWTEALKSVREIHKDVIRFEKDLDPEQ